MSSNKKYLEFYLGCAGVLDIGTPPHYTSLEDGASILSMDVLKYVLESESATFKPYLRPLADILFEESDELKTIECKFKDTPYKDISDWAYKVDWLLNKHFDIFSLIPQGLAKDKNKELNTNCQYF